MVIKRAGDFFSVSCNKRNSVSVINKFYCIFNLPRLKRKFISEFIKDRYSCRKFKNTPVEKEKIEKILEAALVAPTACNLQPQRILVLTDKNIIKALDDEKCTRYTFDAPLIFVMCVDRSKAWTRKYDGISSAEVDSSIAMTQMMLQAQELGLGTTWVMALNPDIAKKVLNIPENLGVISFMPTGYPADDAQINPLHYKHIDIDEMVKFNKF